MTDQNKWVGLNTNLMRADYEECKKLLNLAKKQKRPLTEILRIHSRFNRLRAKKEREEIREKWGG